VTHAGGLSHYVLNSIVSFKRRKRKWRKTYAGRPTYEALLGGTDQFSGSEHEAATSTTSVKRSLELREQR